MRELIQIQIAGHCLEIDKIKMLEKKLKKYQPKRERADLFFSFEKGDEGLEVVKNCSEEMHIPYFTNRGMLEFTEEEYNNLQYFMVVFPLGFSSDCSRYGVRAKYEQCSTCKSGAVLLDQVRFPVSKALRYGFFELLPTIIISAKLKNELEMLGATGYICHEIVDTKTNQPDDRFYQLEVKRYLSAVKSYTRINSKCPVCGMESVQLEGTIQYTMVDVEERNDFYYTSESFWLGENFGAFRHHYLIVSKRVKELLINYGLQWIKPVYIQGMFKEK